MTAVWFPAIVSACLTAMAAPLVRSALLRAGRVDVPNHRSSHEVATPRGGGIACLVGASVGAFAAQLMGLPVPHIALATCLLVALVGLADDSFTLSAAPRLLAQVVMGGLTGWATGTPALAVLGAMLFPVVVNAINFMDGINGITGMVSLLWGLTAALLGELNEAHALSVVGLVTAGAALGFLPFNAPRATIFLGDVGSYLFGALCGAGILIGLAAHVPVLPLVAPLALYLVDVFLTLARRLLSRESLTTAHRDHVYQRLTSRGLEHVQVAGIVVGLSAVITVGWIALPFAAAATLTVVTATLYVMLPAVSAKSDSPRV